MLKLLKDQLVEGTYYTFSGCYHTTECCFQFSHVSANNAIWDKSGMYCIDNKKLYPPDGLPIIPIDRIKWIREATDSEIKLMEAELGKTA